MSIDCPPLLQLLFELIWDYLLGDHGFSAGVVDGAIIFRVFDLWLGIGVVEVLVILVFETVFIVFTSHPNRYLVYLSMFVRYKLIFTPLHGCLQEILI